MGLQPDELHLIDAELWARTRSGARAGRGFRYQDAVSAWLAAAAWSGDAAWVTVVPEGVDDVTLHGEDLETRVQIKSRHDPRGLFSTAEIAGYVAKAALDLPDGWSDDPRYRIAVILERPPADLVETGFHQSLASSGQALDAFTQALRVQLPDGFDLDALLHRISVVVEPEPLTRCADALAPSGLDPAARTLVAQMLRDIAGDRADRNYRASPPAISTLGRTDVQERLDHAAGLIDPTGYLDLTAGLADVADFTAAMPTEGFYSGVNTAPGHVGAGLVFDRPEAVAEVLEALESRSAALVVGPSGAGKSALAWLAAYHSRHTVRWYRLRGLRQGDVGRIATLAKRLEATTARPVGFVLDDVGRDATDGWDDLVKEVEQTPGLLALATVREEDLFLLATAARTRAIRPTLNEDLAARLWAALHAQGSVEFAHWREPFEKSEGLLLEYVHLLTAGQRLAETIQEQVRRRLAEGRGAELRVLRAVACASAHGGAVDPIRLRYRENLDEIAFAQAMQRLVHEHAIRVRPDGSIAGLHEIRSQHLDEAVRSLLGDTPDVAIVTAVATLGRAALGQNADMIGISAGEGKNPLPLADTATHRVFRRQGLGRLGLTGFESEILRRFVSNDEKRQRRFPPRPRVSRRKLLPKQKRTAESHQVGPGVQQETGRRQQLCFAIPTPLPSGPDPSLTLGFCDGDHAGRHSGPHFGRDMVIAAAALQQIARYGEKIGGLARRRQKIRREGGRRRAQSPVAAPRLKADGAPPTVIWSSPVCDETKARQPPSSAAPHLGSSRLVDLVADHTGGSNRGCAHPPVRLACGQAPESTRA